MQIATAHLVSTSAYSQSRYYGMDDEAQPKTQGESARRTESALDYEKRTWRYRCHATQDGRVFIPPMAFKNALSEAAKYRSMQIPGKGKSTYTKHFEAGVMCVDPVVLPLTREDVAGDWLFVPASGKRGDGKRVLKCFPVIPAWAGEVKFFVLDEVITPEVFKQHLIDAGSLIGIGRFRPRNNGFYGRFKVEDVKWSEA